MRAAIRQVLFGQPPFSPRRLFSAGEQGVWYDPSDFSTMFQDSAGTTPVTAVGDPVGLILDKSGRGNHASQSTTTSRPILRQDESGRYYLDFDGTDDWLQTGNINFSAKDEISVFIGSRTVGTTQQCVIELSSALPSNNGSFFLQVCNPANTINYASKGITSASAATTGVYIPPITYVGCFLSKISTDTCIARLNGAQQASSATDQGSGSYGSAYPLYIGRRAGTSIPLTGRIYSLIVRNELTFGGDLTNTEAWTNRKTRAY